MSTALVTLRRTRTVAPDWYDTGKQRRGKFTMPRAMKPDEALAVRYPTVAATWHADRNGDRTPDNTSAKNSFRAWWRCPAGHEWPEIVATRTSLPAWKGGDVAACRLCTGHHVVVSFDCGHTAEAPAQYAEPSRGCTSCRAARAAERRQQGQVQYAENSAKSRQGYVDALEEATALVDQLPLPAVPAPLIFEWRNATLHAVRAAIVSERSFRKSGAIGTALAHAQDIAATLLPGLNDVRTAAAQRGPISIANRAHWPAGWAAYLGAPLWPRLDDGPVVDGVTEALTASVEQALAQFGRERQLTARSVTRWLTETVASWAYAQETKWRDRRWNVYRELSLPVTPGGSERFGRLDLTLMRPDAPDVVIEIDSAHKPESLHKLLFARDAGAVAIWVRWRGGRVETADGVAVIDLVERTRGLAA